MKSRLIIVAIVAIVVLFVIIVFNANRNQPDAVIEDNQEAVQEAVPELDQ